MSSSVAPLRVLGVDPGSRKAGWGLVDVDLPTRKISHVDNGVLFLTEGAPLPARLVDLSRGLHQVVERFRPNIAAVEDIFLQKSVRSALVLGQARGAVLATLGLCRVPVFHHTASQVKSRVAGRGQASKEQVAHLVCLTLGLREHPFEDAADALAVALCQAFEQLALGQAASPATEGASSPGQRRPSPPRGTKGRRAGLAALARAQGKI